MKINKLYSPYLLIFVSSFMHAAAPKRAASVPATPPASVASLQAEGVGSGQMIFLGQRSAANSASSLNDGFAAAAAAGGQATPERSQSLPQLQVLGAAAAAAAQPRENEMQKSLGTLVSEKAVALRMLVAKGGNSPRTNALYKKDLAAYNAIIASLDYLNLDLETRKTLAESASAGAAKE